MAVAMLWRAQDRLCGRCLVQVAEAEDWAVLALPCGAGSGVGRAVAASTICARTRDGRPAMPLISIASGSPQLRLRLRLHP